MTRRFTNRATAVALVAIPGLLLAGFTDTSAAPSGRAVPVGAVADAPGAYIAPSLKNATGAQQVVVQLARPALAASVAEDALADNALPTKTSQRASLDAIKTDQDAVVSAARQLGGTEQGRVSRSLNAVVMTIDASRVNSLAAIAGVISVRPVLTYSTEGNDKVTNPGYTPESGSLEQAAQYLGVDAVRAAGYDGTGVKVAVLDSGIDYTHGNLGGPGTEAFYAQCYGNIADPLGAGPKDVAATGDCANYFGPSAPKVKGGYDFVGEQWPIGPLAADPNPLDFEGHGTHVADIIGGHSDDHHGLAPGVSLYAIKVCSAVATSCNGLALLQGVDWALDPNGDGDMSDAMDLMNLSLGSDYGQDEDDLSLALDNAVRAGVVVVASAGNGGDRPFKVGSPSIAARVISVAQTALPDDESFVIDVTSPANVPGLTDNKIKLTVLQPWGGPVPASPGLIGNLARPTGSRLGCNPGDFGAANAGKIALVDRGSCAISIKASNAEAAGAIGFILVNNTGGAPGAFSYGGGTITIPTLAVSIDAGTALRNAVAAGPVSVQVDPADAISLTGTMVSSSSRGPSIDGIRVKPDIGAPGAWLSAEVGTGEEETNFGGTSGAAPTVSGVAALVLQKFPNESPVRIKTRLLNSADLSSMTPDLEGNLYATPISRIGAGEVRGAAATGTFRMRSGEKGGGNIALGSLHLSSDVLVSREVKLENTSNSAQTITITPYFRDATDASYGAVEVVGTGTFTVPRRSTREVEIQFIIRAANLPAWQLTGAAGFTGGDGTVLNDPELDGYLVATASSGESQHLGWHVLPHRSAKVTSPRSVNLRRNSSATVPLVNSSAIQAGGVQVFSLTGTSPSLPRPAAGDPGSPGSNVALIDLLSVGVRDFVGDDVIQFAINGNGRRATPLYPAGYEVDIDTNRDGNVDFYVYQAELGGFAVSGEAVVVVQNAVTNATQIFYYAIADYDSANMVLTAPLSALGLVPGQSFDFVALAVDNYFSGLITDAIEGMTYTVGSPKFVAANGSNRIDETVVPASGVTNVSVVNTGSTAPTSETGLLLLLDDAARHEAQTIVARI
jgi:subtilisin family serine protease